MELGAVRSVALVALEGLEIWSVFHHVVSSCDLGKIHPWLLSPARPGGPRVWCGPVGVRAQAPPHPAPFLSSALLQPLLFHCLFPSPTVRPESRLALLRPPCSCVVSGLGHHSSRPTGEGETRGNAVRSGP